MPNYLCAHLTSPRCLLSQFSLATLALLPLLLNAQDLPEDIILPTPAGLPATDIRHYYEDLLRLALNKTQKTDGNYIISYGDKKVGPERERAMVIADTGLTVIWGSVTPERMTQLQVVPVDIVKNLNSYRALIIRSDEQTRFNNINNLSELQPLTGGSGINWAHNRIFEANGLNILTSGSFAGIFKMLAAGRVDYVARAPYEVLGEIFDYKAYDIKIEERLLIKFNQPLNYSFFVNKHNTKLANRLERGLHLAQADGSLDALFFHYPSFAYGYQLVQNAKHLDIEINNPSSITP